ncbi:MAG: transposase [Caldilineaceae bacterium SB0670_bin_27]|uniref:Transposase n=1 Tax=Caldilineaceae bacterium SB0664_bin_27 TaxID=2605260 RepID=A0A6B0YZA4_9CHLR|nr:transposase [Caldilineaceae bacterium SB0664_bin_27]MYJ78612.1 transposase [Caldilineaceae bacterium SB0670_bin_27]
MTQSEVLLTPFDFDAVIAGKGYESGPLRVLLAAQQLEVIIPSRSYRKQPRDYDRIRFRERNIVDRFINKLKWCRRISTRYEKLARRFIAFLHFASTLIWLQRNVNGT